MSYEEFTKWQVYFDLRPIGWRDDTRFLKIMQCLGVKEPGEKIFESLDKLKKGEDARIVRNELMQSLRNSAMFTYLMNATGGDKLELMERL